MYHEKKHCKKGLHNPVVIDHTPEKMVRKCRGCGEVFITHLKGKRAKDEKVAEARFAKAEMLQPIGKDAALFEELYGDKVRR